MVFLEVLAMFKRIQYTFVFFLCLTMLICLLPAAYADGLSDLQAAIADGVESCTLTESLTIPAGLELGEIQTTLIVPNGITLTIAGGDSGSGRRELSVGDLDIQSGGSVVIENNALLEVSGDLTLNGQLTIGKASELYITDQDEELVSSSNIILQGDFSHIVVHYYPDDENELLRMFDGETGLFYGAENLPDYAHGNMGRISSPVRTRCWTSPSTCRTSRPCWTSSARRCSRSATSSAAASGCTSRGR